MPPDFATTAASAEERLNEVLLAYVEALEAGLEPDRSQLLTANPDLRRDLETFLVCHDEVDRLTAPWRGAPGAEPVPEVLFRGDNPPSGAALEIRPHSAYREGQHGIGQLGDFQLLREIGRGGMGVVYEAHQISLQRRVALKVLPFAAAIDPRRLQRFKTEALAAANLQHERIVPVHAVGCERGVHYYAMQYIEGQSLAALIAELRRLGAAQLRRLREAPDRAGSSTEACDAICGRASLELPAGDAASAAAVTISRERSSGGSSHFAWIAELGQQAALALEHAHQAGIVHRDIKPSNLLLDLREQIWVTDFGLARVTGDSGVTMSGELLGTLRYASPEQLLARRGIVDHRSDVYSLGATLYELLTLRPLFEGRDRHELLRRIADDEPPAPRSLEPSIPVELETIVLKALRKEPSDRYATAQELADDLGRFLEHRPILAQRPTAAERMRNLARRHPTLVGACLIMLILLSAASMVSTALIRREQRKTKAEQERAESAYLHERQRAEEAEARFRLARRSVDELIQVSEEELVHRPGMGGLRRRLLASALAYYQEFIEERKGDARAQAELRDTTSRVEKILADLAVLRAAGEVYLLAQPAALDDLGLDDAQRASAREIAARAAKQWTESISDARRTSPRERVQRALEQARANEAEVTAILTPSQQVRLRQIVLQSEGPSAFREPEVVAALRLNSEQSERIRTIQQAAFFGPPRANRVGGSADEPDQGHEHRLYPGIEDILAVLNAEQVRVWRQMAGEPVKGPLIRFPAPAAPQRESKRSAR